MGLSEKEKALLASLTKKAEEPDAPPIGRSVSAHIDLGDDKQIEKAIKFGFLTSGDLDDTGEEDEGGEEKDDTPKRKGYFNAE